MRLARAEVLVTEEDYRNGLRYDFSSVPWHRSEGRRNLQFKGIWLGFWPVLFPLAADASTDGTVRFSWSQLGLARRGWSAALGPSVFWSGSRTFYLGGRLRTPVILPLRSLLPNRSFDSQWDCAFTGCATASSFSVGASLLQRRLRIGYMWDTGRVNGASHFRNPRLLLGVSDVPGMIHLLFRQR